MCVPQGRQATTDSGTCSNDANNVVVIEDNGQVMAKIALCDFCHIWALDKGLIPDQWSSKV